MYVKRYHYRFDVLWVILSIFLGGSTSLRSSFIFTSVSFFLCSQWRRHWSLLRPQTLLKLSSRLSWISRCWSEPRHTKYRVSLFIQSSVLIWRGEKKSIKEVSKAHRKGRGESRMSWEHTLIDLERAGRRTCVIIVVECELLLLSQRKHWTRILFVRLVPASGAGVLVDIGEVLVISVVVAVVIVTVLRCVLAVLLRLCLVMLTILSLRLCHISLL